MQYSFTCPLEGCSQVMTVEAQSEDEAIDSLTQEAKKHLASVHPDIQKSDDQVRGDIASMMIKEDKGQNVEMENV